METIAFFDAKPYDKIWFDQLNTEYTLNYFENNLNASTAVLAARLCGRVRVCS